MGLKVILDNMKGQKPELDQAGQNQQKFNLGLAAELARIEQRPQVQANHQAEVERTQQNAGAIARGIAQPGAIERLATRLDSERAREALAQKRNDYKTEQEMIAEGKRSIPAREDYLKDHPRSRDPERDR